MFKKIILIISLVSMLFSNELDQIKKEFLETTDKMVKIVKDKTIQKDIRNDKIVKVISPIFDFELMAKISLGKIWKTMNKDQKELFVNQYVKRMKKSYSSKIDKYSDEKITINSIKKIKRTRIVLNTSLIGTATNFEIIYKYYKSRKLKPNKKSWLVYDVVIEGVSIIKTDKAQFRAILKTNSIEELIKKL